MSENEAGEGEIFNLELSESELERIVDWYSLVTNLTVFNPDLIGEKDYLLVNKIQKIRGIGL